MSDDRDDLVARSDSIGQSDDDDSYYNHVSDSDPSQYITDNDSSSEEEEVSDRPANYSVPRSPNTLTTRPYNELTEILIWLRVPIDLVEAVESHIIRLRAERDWARRFDRLEQDLEIIRQINVGRTLQDREE